MSKELKDYFMARGIATSRSTPYHPIGNGQVERYNGIIWRAVRLCLKSYQMSESSWELALPEALHSIRSLLSTATNTTPHERFFSFQRKSSHGTSLPSWLQPGPVMLRRFVRGSKLDPLVDRVELTDVNPTYAHVRFPDGRESTVSLRDLAPCARSEAASQDSAVETTLLDSHDLHTVRQGDACISDQPVPSSEPGNTPQPTAGTAPVLDLEPVLRRSTRPVKAPDRLTY